MGIGVILGVFCHTRQYPGVTPEILPFCLASDSMEILRNAEISTTHRGHFDQTPLASRPRFG